MAIFRAMLMEEEVAISSSFSSSVTHCFRTGLFMSQYHSLCSDRPITKLLSMTFMTDLHLKVSAMKND